MAILTRRAVLMYAGVISSLVLFTIELTGKLNETLSRVQPRGFWISASRSQEQHSGQLQGHLNDPEEFRRKPFPGFDAEEMDDVRYKIIQSCGTLKRMYIAKSNLPGKFVRLSAEGEELLKNRSLGESHPNDSSEDWSDPKDGTDDERRAKDNVEGGRRSKDYSDVGKRPKDSFDERRSKDSAGNERRPKDGTDFGRRPKLNKDSVDGVRRSKESSDGRRLKDSAVGGSPPQRNQTLVTTKDNKTVVNIPDFIFNSLPLGIFEQKSSHDSCSLVGNAGSLIDSGCGRQIDSSEYVIRCNFPPVGGEYAKDVGQKTDLLSVNPSLFQTMYKNFPGNMHKEKFIKDVKNYKLSTLYTHPFRFASQVKKCYRAHGVLKAAGMVDLIRFSHPKFLDGITRFWKRQGLNETRPSTGLMLTALAITKCKQVTLYGFWPFPTYNGQARMFHYFDRAIIWNMKFKNKVLEHKILTQMNPYHNLTEEFLVLNSLHERGVLKLQLGPCDNTIPSA